MFFLLFFVWATINATAQEKTNPVQAVKKGASKLDTRDRLIFEFTHDRWLNKPDEVDIKWYSRGFATYLMYDIALGKSPNLSVAPGFGIATYNVFNNSLISKDTDGKTIFTQIPDSIDYKKNKLVTSYLDVPLEIRMRTKPNSKNNKSFRLAVGARVGLLINGHTKYKGKDLTGGNSDVKFKNLLVPNINKFRYGLSGRIGYGNINVFGYYSLSPLFEKDKGPEINQFSVGISFNSL